MICFSSSSICRCFLATAWTLKHEIMVQSYVLENTKTLEKQHLRKFICMISHFEKNWKKIYLHDISFWEKLTFFSFTSICRCFWATAFMLKHRILSKLCNKKSTRTLQKPQPPKTSLPNHSCVKCQNHEIRRTLLKVSKSKVLTFRGYSNRSF